MAQDLQAWFQSWCIVPPVIAGVRMLPYSLSHGMFLDALNSPLLTTGTPVTHGQLWEALGVCSRDHAGNVRVYSCGRPDRVILKAARRWGSKSLDAIETALRAYMGEYTTVPPMAPAKGKRGMAAPGYNHQVRVLCSVYGVPLDQALNFPAGLARCLYETDQEAQGGKALMHPVDVLKADILADIRKAKAANDEAGADSLRATLHKLMEAYPPEKS